MLRVCTPAGTVNFHGLIILRAKPKLLLTHYVRCGCVVLCVCVVLCCVVLWCVVCCVRCARARVLCVVRVVCLPFCVCVGVLELCALF